eukprot:1098708-Amorphochlora_amoeboformis.AAC.2
MTATLSFSLSLIGERKRSENASPSSDRDEAVMPQEQRSTLPQEENSGEADNRFGSMADSKKGR